MRPSQKADYAMRAMLDLARAAEPGAVAPTAAIARRTRAPAKFLEAILGELRRAGLVESRRGAAGGHRLARPGSRITAGEVWRAVDGPLGPAARAGRRGAAADPAARALRDLWEEVEQAVTRVVDGTTLEDLARRAQESAGVHDFTI